MLTQKDATGLWLSAAPTAVYINHIFSVLPFLTTSEQSNQHNIFHNVPSTSLWTSMSSGGRGCDHEAQARDGGRGGGRAAWCPHSLTRSHSEIPSEAIQAGLELITRASHSPPLPHAAAGPGQAPCLSGKSSQQGNIKNRKTGYKHNCNTSQALDGGP